MAWCGSPSALKTSRTWSPIWTRRSRHYDVDMAPTKLAQLNERGQAVKRILVSWSSGKDSAWCLELLRRSGEYEIAGLVTTFNAAFDRVAMHSTRREVVEAQARAAGLSVWTIPLPWPCSNEQYEAAMSDLVRRAVSDGIAAMAFGDL